LCPENQGLEKNLQDVSAFHENRQWLIPEIQPERPKGTATVFGKSFSSVDFMAASRVCQRQAIDVMKTCLKHGWDNSSMATSSDPWS
jgi:hypothetical protein